MAAWRQQDWAAQADSGCHETGPHGHSGTGDSGQRRAGLAAGNDAPRCCDLARSRLPSAIGQCAAAPVGRREPGQFAALAAREDEVAPGAGPLRTIAVRPHAALPASEVIARFVALINEDPAPRWVLYLHGLEAPARRCYCSTWLPGAVCGCRRGEWSGCGGCRVRRLPDADLPAALAGVVNAARVPVARGSTFGGPAGGGGHATRPRGPATASNLYDRH